MKVWITKYAMRGKILEVEAQQVDDVLSMVSVRNPGELTQYFHGAGREWHRTKEGAIAKAEEMRVAKIKSLQKSIAKMEKLKWA